MSKSNKSIVPRILGHDTIVKIHVYREEHEVVLLILIHYDLFTHPYHVVKCPLFVFRYNLAIEIVAIQKQGLILKLFDFEELVIWHPGIIVKCGYNVVFKSHAVSRCLLYPSYHRLLPMRAS